MARISIVLGKDEEPDIYNALASAIREEFRKRYVVGHHLVHKSQSAYVLALHFNMLEDEIDYENAKKELREKIVSNGYKLTTGFIGTAYLCPALSEYDYEKEGFQWADCSQEQKMIYAIRRSGKNKEMLALFNLGNKAQIGYELELEDAKDMEQILDSDSSEFGGSNGSSFAFEKGVLRTTLAPYSAMLFEIKTA